MSLNNYFDNIYCINLDEATERWDHCLTQFEKHNFIAERFSEIKKWSVITPQCQVSLPYVLWKTNIDKDILKNKIWDTNIYDIYSHNK